MINLDIQITNNHFED